MRRALVAILYGVLAFGVLWFLSGVFRFPHAPINPCGTDQFCGKGGRLYSREVYEAFLLWQTVFLISFPLAMIAFLIIRFLRGKKRRAVLTSGH